MKVFIVYYELESRHSLRRNVICSGSRGCWSLSQWWQEYTLDRPTHTRCKLHPTVGIFIFTKQKKKIKSHIMRS